MHSLKICKQYFNAVNDRNIDEILSFFAPNAAVSAPLYGTVSVRRFHEVLFREQEKTVTRIKNIFATVNSISAVALHFSHIWTLTDGRTIEIDGVNIFELTSDGTRFAKLTIVYDPTPVLPYLADKHRSAVEENKRPSSRVNGT